MQAVYRDQYGPPAVLALRELAMPEPGDKQIRIRVRAATVNRTDCAILRGRPLVMRLFCGLLRPQRHATGTDFAGEVDAVGAAVTRWQIGDRVWGFDDNGLGSHSQYIVLPQDKAVMRMPASVSFEQAAASIEGAHYAFNFISKVKLLPGQSAMLNGATGAIGSALLQLFKHSGLSVTATCASPHAQRIKDLGADRLIDYRLADFTQDGERYDYVFDAVGKSSFGRCRHLLKPRGIYISSEPGAFLQNVWLTLITPLLGGRRVVFPVPRKPLVSLAFIGDLLERGSFAPLIDRTFPLAEIRAAFDLALSGEKIGNLVLKLD